MTDVVTKKRFKPGETIDLTGSDEEGPPPKRARSESKTTPPIYQTHSGQLHTGRIDIEARRVPKEPTFGPFKYFTDADTARLITKSKATSKGQVLKNGVKKNSVHIDLTRESSSLTGDLFDLSIRASPARQLDNSESKQGAPLAVNRAPDRTVVKHISEADQARIPSVATSVSSDEGLNLEDWKIPPPPEPIRFDPSIPTVNQGKTRLSTDNHTSRTSLATSVSVNIPPRANTSLHTAHSKPLPISKSPQPSRPTSTFRIDVPLPASQVLKYIKEDISYIRSHPKVVETSLGVVRFDDAELNAKSFARGSQKKQKAKVDRDSILLDFGSPAKVRTHNQNSNIVEPRKAIHQILLERFEQTQPPLRFKNRKTDRCLHGKFQFVHDYVYNRSTRKRHTVSLNHGNCRCSTAAPTHGVCGCVAVQIKESEDTKGIFRDVVNVVPYARGADGKTVLSDTVLEAASKKTVILYECGNTCKCGILCTNKVVQKGRTIPLQIFETGRCGFGVRALEKITRGQFIDIYLGEVLTNKELERREQAVEEDTPSYVMSMDMFVTDESATYHVDGHNFGSLTRFVNHSCDPNAKTIPVILSGDSKYLYHVAFFAVKDIPEGKEITIDYNPDHVLVDDEIADSSISQCKCGSENCRKTLWMPSKERRKRKKFLQEKED